MFIIGTKYPNLSCLCAEVLARLGQQTQLNNSKGLRILSIDGGGMKGLLALEVLRYESEFFFYPDFWLNSDGPGSQKLG